MPDIEIVVDLGILGEKEVTVEYSYRRGRPGKMTLKGGDPGYPEDPAEIDIDGISHDDLGAALQKVLEDYQPLFDKIIEAEEGDE